MIASRIFLGMTQSSRTSEECICLLNVPVSQKCCSPFNSKMFKGDQEPSPYTPEKCSFVKMQTQVSISTTSAVSALRSQCPGNSLHTILKKIVSSRADEKLSIKYKQNKQQQQKYLSVYHSVLTRLTRK